MVIINIIIIDNYDNEIIFVNLLRLPSFSLLVIFLESGTLLFF